LQQTTGQTIEANRIRLEEAYQGSVSREPDAIPQNAVEPRP
jgi:hypothetical protein